MARAISMGRREALSQIRDYTADIVASTRRIEPRRLAADRGVQTALALANLTLAVAFATAMADIIGPVTGAGVCLAAAGVALLAMLRGTSPAARSLPPVAATRSPALAMTVAGAADGARRDVAGLLAMMSHELRTPLNAIIGNADAIRLEALGPIGAARYRESAAHIREGGQVLLRATEDMLALTSAVAAAAFAPHQPVDLETMTLDVLRAASGDASRKGVELSWRPGTGRAVLSEASALRHALARLVDAALNHAERGADIHVELTQGSDTVEVMLTLTHADHVNRTTSCVDAGADRTVAALEIAVARTLCALLGTHLHSAYGIDGRWRAIVELPAASLH